MENGSSNNDIDDMAIENGDGNQGVDINLENNQAKSDESLNSKPIDESNASNEKSFWEDMWPTLEKQGWSKVSGTEDKLLLIRDGVDVNSESAVKGVDYFDSTVDVINFIEKQKPPENPDDSQSPDLSEEMDYEQLKKQKQKEREEFARQKYANRPRRTTGSNCVKPTEGNEAINLPPSTPTPRKVRYDESWKEHGTFPKKESQVGPDYQVPSIPKAGSYENEDNETSESYVEKIWDPQEAREKGVNLDEDHDIIANLPYNIKGAALIELAKLEYNVETFKERIDDLCPSDGTNWSEEKKAQYHSEIFRLRKDFATLCKSLDISLATCLAYYLGTYKHSKDYRVLKTACIEDRVRMSESADYVEHDACAVCGDGGNLLICDGCEGEYHLACVKPALAAIPEGHWECDECVDRKLMAARDFMIKNTSLFEERPSNKRSHSEMEGSGKVVNREPPTKTSYQPTKAVIEAVRRFAEEVHAALTKKE